ncbi:MAG: hypothetical protein JWP92_3221 [Caulobacter sp.]|nr:hypothetical protein [Caulobacter sp.]
MGRRGATTNTALRRLWAIVACWLLVSTTAMAASDVQPRTRLELSTGWRFKLGEADAAAKARGFDDSGWEAVSVPHSWNRMGGGATRGPSYQNVYGPGWYRLSFKAPTLAKDQKAWLQFDAASLVSEVWLNGALLGRHAGAFARFRFDATAALKAGGDNLLVVRADNSKADAPGSPAAEVIPISGDWPMYGGLYRPVSLIVTNAAHFDMLDHGGPGIAGRTVSADAQGAVIAVVSRLKNDASRPSTVRVAASVIDAAGTVVGSARETRALPVGAAVQIEQTIALTRPRLWNGTADPYLYRLRVELFDGRGAVLDRVEQPLGVRTVRIDPDQGLFLNGRHLALHGVSRHQDRPDTGWAIDAAAIAEDFAIIREIGANTVRLAHYQHDQAAYDLADKMGLIIWAEIPLVDRTSPPGRNDTTPALADNAEQQLRELIAQNANHPSIVVWGVGNEVNLTAAKGRTVSNAKPLLSRLNAVAKGLDPSRPTTLADCCGSVPSEARAGLDTVAGLTDVIGYNRYLGWYGGRVGDVGAELTRLHKLYPNQPISVSEYGAGGALSQHSDNPLGGPIHAFGRPHPEEFQNYVLEESWKQIKPLPFVWASWVWNLFDFSNDARMEGDLLDTNDKGLVTFDRKTRKDAFYFFKANWNPEPMVHIVGRRHVDRAYPVADLKVYSNAASVDLSRGGQVLGTAPCADGICVLPGVALVAGDNAITASARFGDQIVSDAVTWRLDGGPGQYRIRAGNLVGVRTAQGQLFGSDSFFTGGEGKDRDPPAASRGAFPGPKTPVAGAIDDALYESWRQGDFAYAVPVPNGAYVVTLHLFEPKADAKAGSRRFDVLAQGRPAITGLDIAAEAGGPFRALTRTVPVQVTDGRLTLAFRGTVGPAVVSAIEILPQPATASPSKTKG